MPARLADGLGLRDVLPVLPDAPLKKMVPPLLSIKDSADSIAKEEAAVAGVNKKSRLERRPESASLPFNKAQGGCSDSQWNSRCGSESGVGL